MKLYLVICYAKHDSKVASVDKFLSYDEALDYLLLDAANTYDEEVANSGCDPDDIVLRTDEFNDTAEVINFSGVCIWTWEICEIEIDDGRKEREDKINKFFAQLSDEELDKMLERNGINDKESSEAIACREVKEENERGKI